MRYIGVDQYEFEGKSQMGLAIFNGEKITYVTNKKWKIKFIIWFFKTFKIMFPNKIIFEKR